MVLTMRLREVGLLVTGAAGLGKSRDGPMGPSATVGAASSSGGDFA